MDYKGKCIFPMVITKAFENHWITFLCSRKKKNKFYRLLRCSTLQHLKIGHGEAKAQSHPDKA